MAVTPSTMQELGSPAPDFQLTDAVNGNDVSLNDFDDAPALLVMFICNHCPYVIHVRDELGEIAGDYMPKGLAIIAINSNSIKTHPLDGPDHMQRLALELGWAFPFLFDSTQEVAAAYRAACTPDLFLYDGQRRLFYRGQLDDSRPGSGIPVTGRDLRAAIDAVLSSSPPPDVQRPSMGCNIKWARGNEPEYY